MIIPFNPHRRRQRYVTGETAYTRTISLTAPIISFLENNPRVFYLLHKPTRWVLRKR